MADQDSGEKTEQPTAKKLLEAKKKGQIARSKDLGTMFVLLGGVIGFLLIGNDLVNALSSLMKRLFSLNRQEVMDIHALYQLLNDGIFSVFIPFIWLHLIIVLAAFIGNSLLGGLNFSWDAMKPKASKLSPIAGFKRMFGVQAYVELLKSILKFFVVCISAFLLLSAFFEQIISLSAENIPINFAHSVNLLLGMFFALVLSLLIIVMVDAPYQVWNHNRQLKMSKQEVKDEMKNTEGSPETKGRIRRAQYDMSQRRMMQEVAESDVVITNPTHYAVALKYDADQGGAPVLVAKGVDEMALHIRRIAKEHEVEIVPSPALARSLYYSADVNEEIPEQLFAAVAQVLAFIFQLAEHKKGKAKRPQALSKNLPIPESFRY